MLEIFKCLIKDFLFFNERVEILVKNNKKETIKTPKENVLKVLVGLMKAAQMIEEKNKK